MIDELFELVVEKLGEFLGVAPLEHVDDPVLIFGQFGACEILHNCANYIVHEYSSCQVEELNELLYRANILYEKMVVQDKMLAIGFIASVTSAVSKIYVNRIEPMKKIGIVIPVYNETKRIAQQNALNARLYQYMWLFSDRVGSNQHLLFVDDMSTDETKTLLGKRFALLSEKYQKEISIIGLEEIENNRYSYYMQEYRALNNYTRSVKGGSVYFGLLWMQHEEFDYVLCIDFDLTFSIEHLGVLLNELLINPCCGVVINSRRKMDSKGYLNKNEGNMVSVLFQTINNELMNSNITDCNSGCKMIRMDFFAEVSKEITDVDLSLDAELLMLCLRNGYQVVENAAVCFHKYVEGKQGVDRNYEKMLKRIHQDRILHNYNCCSHTPLYNKMINIGFYQLVELLENQKRPQDTNLQTLVRCIDEEKI